MVLPDYNKILTEEGVTTVPSVHSFFHEEIAHDWVDLYKRECRVFGDVTLQRFYGFTFAYDHSFNNEPEIRSTLPDPRVVFAFGITNNDVNQSNRRTMRRFWGSSTEAFSYLKGDYDKGHFIAHISGGPIDINLFPQRRDINRGWSKEGKRYRGMERHIAAHPGTFVFSRPIYNDFSCCPAFIEFGYYENSSFVVEVFPNK